MTVTRSIDPEHNWFWQQGYHDGLDGLRAIAPDETRYSFQRSDYFAGYDAGSEDRSSEADDKTKTTLSACSIWNPPSAVRSRVWGAQPHNHQAETVSFGLGELPHPRTRFP